jgi:hypothetical protein
MSQKKVKGVKVYLSVKDIEIIEDLISSKAHFVGGFKKLKKSEVDLWHLFDDICQDLKKSNYKFEKKIDKFLH